MMQLWLLSRSGASATALLGSVKGEGHLHPLAMGLAEDLERTEQQAVKFVAGSLDPEPLFAGRNGRVAMTRATWACSATLSKSSRAIACSAVSRADDTTSMSMTVVRKVQLVAAEGCGEGAGMPTRLLLPMRPGPC
jgi:hypothetical protein